ncbi:MAG: hypothetical protein AAF557_04530 [Pseudomonadota bacterium]
MRLILATLIAITAGSAFADTCYRRVYSEDHLRKNPAQVVSSIEVRFTEGIEARQAFARVIFKGSSKVWTNGLYCSKDRLAEDPGATMRCGVECDGGTFTVRPKSSNAIYLTTKGGFNVGGACPEGDDVLIRLVTDEGAEKTVFRLDKLEDCP